MTKKLTLLIALACLTSVAVAQQEPEFIGNAVAVLSDSTTIPLEKQTAYGSARASASAYIPIAGGFIGKAKITSKVNGSASPVSLSPKDGAIRIIVRVSNNSLEPSSVVNVFKLSVKKDYRYVEATSGIPNNGIEFISYDARKFGESSYLLVLSGMQPGEYALTLDGSREVFHLFSVK
ncbi:MAG TPA: hypothetical protein VMW01_12140 [Williamwhitmania sp.]|nr:hypothetical protein [Williamwhitmania sp.]